VTLNRLEVGNDLRLPGSEAVAPHRSHSIELERQVARKLIAGDILHALVGQHDVPRNLIRFRVPKFEAVVR
jgi:hypothetical protein